MKLSRAFLRGGGQNPLPLFLLKLLDFRLLIADC